MAKKSSSKRRPGKSNLNPRQSSMPRDRRQEFDSEEEYEAIYEAYNDDFEPQYDLDSYERELERERERRAERENARRSGNSEKSRKASKKNSDKKKSSDRKASAKKKSSAPAPSGRDKTRRPIRPLGPERGEDMLSEFSDDTNTFYTDEQVERRRRETEHKQKQKKQKKVEKRKPMSPTKRKLIHIFSYAAIITVVIVVGIVLSLTVLFKTQVYEVTGNTRYSETELTEASGIDIGENIFLAPKGAAEKSIKEKYPYVEDVHVSFSIPDTIKIDITEAIEAYLVKLSETDYLVISTKGRILERTNDRSAYNLPIFIGPTPVTGEPGEYVTYEDETVVTMIDSVTRTFADNGYQGITEIDATNMGAITFTYDNRIKVKLGIPEEMDYKIRTAMTIIIEKLDSNKTGTTQGILDVSRCNTTKRSYFNEQQISVIAPTQPSTQPSTNPEDSGTDDWTDDGSYDWTEDDWTDDSDTYDGSDDWSDDGSDDWSDDYSDDGNDGE